MADATTRIEGGIEWYDFQRSDAGGDYTDEECQCARCGSSCDWVICWECDGDGEIEDDSDDAWAYVDPDLFPCPGCGGSGGSWHCISSPDYCRENPMLGREHIQSTALHSEAWNG